MPPSARYTPSTRTPSAGYPTSARHPVPKCYHPVLRIKYKTITQTWSQAPKAKPKTKKTTTTKARDVFDKCLPVGSAALASTDLGRGNPCDGLSDELRLREDFLEDGRYNWDWAG